MDQGFSHVEPAESYKKMLRMERPGPDPDLSLAASFEAERPRKHHLLPTAVELDWDTAVTPDGNIFSAIVGLHVWVIEDFLPKNCWLKRRNSSVLLQSWEVAMRPGSGLFFPRY